MQNTMNSSKLQTWNGRRLVKAKGGPNMVREGNVS
jgi:hypothetical protein